MTGLVARNTTYIYIIINNNNNIEYLYRLNSSVLKSTVVDEVLNVKKSQIDKNDKKMFEMLLYVR